MLIPPGDTLTDTPREHVLPAIWASLSLVKLTSKINHHNHRLVSAEPQRRRDRCGFLGLDLQRGGQCPRSYRPQVVRQGSDERGPQGESERPRTWAVRSAILPHTSRVSLLGASGFPLPLSTHSLLPRWPWNSRKARILSCLANMPMATRNSESDIQWLLNKYHLNKRAAVLVFHLGVLYGE